MQVHVYIVCGAMTQVRKCCAEVYRTRVVSSLSVSMNPLLTSVDLTNSPASRTQRRNWKWCGHGHGPAAARSHFGSAGSMLITVMWCRSVYIVYVRAIATSIANFDLLFCKIEAGTKHERSQCRE